MDYRIGFSKDIHELVIGRKLLLSGVTVPFELGEKAHSDGDVVYHAVAESILGALALGDLGKFFPDSSDDTLNMDSAIIVKTVVKMMKDQGYQINNIDVFISLEKPKLKDYIEEMRKNIADAAGIDPSFVSVKATTEEHLGFTGDGSGIAAHAVCLIEEK